MPASAEIPAPIMYIKVVAVQKLVVNFATNPESSLVMCSRHIYVSSWFTTIHLCSIGMLLPCPIRRCKHAFGFLLKWVFAGSSSHIYLLVRQVIPHAGPACICVYFRRWQVMSYGSFHAHHPHVSDSTFTSKASEPTRGACMHLRLFQKVASDELWLIPCTPPACIR